ncbi:MAG: septal ring lytic transglycosylase RlpA family protein [Telmatospirillum sp.]|nr:septal ring lytic transglycosylase RlpA family protein [Telmatospirillum sp.]
MSPSQAIRRRPDGRCFGVVRSLAVLIAGFACFGVASEAGAATVRAPAPPMAGRPVVCMASWYGGQHAGRSTASGEIHSLVQRTAAHRTLPFGTMVRVTNLRNGRTSVVRINDRGPYVGGRSIDLSERAARDLGMTGEGLARVKLEVLPRGRR